jgi:hypothetical protein
MAVMRVIAMFLVLVELAIFPFPADCKSLEGTDEADSAGYVDRVALELATMGKRGQMVEVARERTLAVLQTNDACSEWFEQANPDVVNVFRSLHYTIEDYQPSYALRDRDYRGKELFKQPWAAHAIEYGGRESTVHLNMNGAFFRRVAAVRDLGPRRWVSPIDHIRMGVADFPGDTAEAQVTILLHELGHVVGRLPLDTDSWDGQSSRNTVEVLRHCRPDITEAAQKNWQREFVHPSATAPGLRNALMTKDREL